MSLSSSGRRLNAGARLPAMLAQVRYFRPWARASLPSAQALSLTIALLTVAVARPEFPACRQGVDPLVPGETASGLIVFGEIGLGANAITYAGLALLVTASVVSLLRGSAKRCNFCFATISVFSKLMITRLTGTKIRSS